jgi:hypothetical protein
MNFKNTHQRRTCFAQLPNVTTVALFEGDFESTSNALRVTFRRRPPARGGSCRRRKFAAEHAARVRRPPCRVCSTGEVNRAIEVE